MTNFKRIAALVVALMLLVSFAAFAEDDLQAQLDAANARIAELEAELETYTVAAKYDGGVISIADVQAQYDYMVSVYSQYGYDISSMADYYISDIVTSLTQDAILIATAKSKGLDEFTEEELASITADCEAEYQSMFDQYKTNFTGTDEEIATQTNDFLAQNNFTMEMLVEYYKDSAIYTRVREYAIEGITASDDDVKAAYDAQLASDKESYAADISGYENAVRGSGVIVYNPEGFRLVKHILILLDDESKTKLTELNTNLAAAETDADKAAIQADIDALYDTLAEKVNEVYAKIEAGDDFDSLIAEYGEDPGMAADAATAGGYYVSADSKAWDAGFTAGAMAISEIGGVSEPVRSSYGLHIIKYISDVTAGEVDFETVKEALRESTQTALEETAYNALVEEWVEAAHPEYFPERIAK